MSYASEESLNLLLNLTIIPLLLFLPRLMQSRKLEAAVSCLQRKGKAMLALMAVLLPPACGCFNAEGLIESRRLTAIRATLQEVELGNFRITIPQGESYDQTTEVSFHVFGRVNNRDVEAVAEVLETYGPVIRDKMLVATRELRPEDLEEPKLTVLREKIAGVINGFLEDEPVQSVGFYHFRYSVF